MMRNSSLKLAVILLGVLVCLVVGLVAAVKSVNLDRVKEILTAQVQTATGRTLTIKGPLEMRLGLIPRIAADGVAISNPSGFTRPEMVTIKHFEMEVALLPLLKREILVNRLVVTAPDLLIETDANGSSNLNFGGAGEKSKVEKQPAASESNSGYRLNLHEVTVENGLFAWHDRNTNKSEAVEIQKFSVKPYQTSSDLLAVKLAAKAQGRQVTMDGTVGGIDTAFGGKPWPIQLKTGIEGLTFLVEGAVADLPAFKGIDVQLTAQSQEFYKVLQLAGISMAEKAKLLGPLKLSTRLKDDSRGTFFLSDIDAELGNRETLLLSAKGSVHDLAKALNVDMALTLESNDAHSLAKLAGTEVYAKGPAKLSGRLRGSDKRWKFSDLKASMAKFDVQGELAVDMTKRPSLSGKLSTALLNLDDVTGPAAPAGEKAGGKSSKTPSGDDRIFPNQPLPVQSLRLADVDLVVRADKLIVQNLQFSEVSSEVHLNGGRLLIKPFRTGVAGGTLEGEMTIDASGKVPVLTLNVSARQVELGKLGNQKILAGGKSDLKAHLKGQGESVRALMASLNGETVLSVGEGKIQNKAINWAAGDLIFQALGALNPMAKSEDTTSLSCAAARFIIQDGIATADKGIAARTDKVDVLGSGTVDLRSENVDMGIQPKPREGVGVSLSSPIAGMTRVRGTLAHPSIGIDAGGTLRTAASIGAAAATGGLSILGEKLVDKVSADADPCRAALGQSGAKQKEAPVPKEQPKKQGGGNFLQNIFGR